MLSSSLAEVAPPGQSCCCFPTAVQDPKTGAVQLVTRINSFLIQPLISMISKGDLSET